MYPAKIIPSHTVANIIIDTIDSVLKHLGLARHSTLEDIIYFIVVIIAAFFIGSIVRHAILKILQKIVGLRNTDFTRELLQEKTLTKVSHIITPMVFLGLMPFAFDNSAMIHTVVLKCTYVYFTLAVAFAVSAVLRFIYSRFDAKENARGLPLKGTLNVAIGITYGVALIVCVSLLVDKSPATLLTGMTAFAAVLMLVFKNSILGFVAGIQLSENDMVHKGDWITVPSTPADGTVEDVSLTTVKVRNFDNTLITVPPYDLVQKSFQNWRGMQESGVRRVVQCIYFNPDRISAPTPDTIAALSAKYPGVAKFVADLKARGATVAWDKGNSPLNGSIETNLGLYRAFITDYLINSDMVDNTRDLFVSIQTVTAKGVPLRLYFFSKTTQWEAYEAVGSAIVEYALLTAPDFGLQIVSADQINVDTNSAKA